MSWRTLSQSPSADSHGSTFQFPTPLVTKDHHLNLIKVVIPVANIGGVFLVAGIVTAAYYIFIKKNDDDDVGNEIIAQPPVAVAPPPPPPLIRVEDLPSVAFSGPGINGFGEGCPICLSDYEVGEMVCVLPSCKHLYHFTCFEHSLATFGNHCPVCQQEIQPPTSHDIV